MIMTIKNSYHDVLSVTKSIFVKSSNWSIDLKNMVSGIRITNFAIIGF